MNVPRMEDIVKGPNNERLQEKMWIEIINRMESLYAKVANWEEEIEQKNRELLKTKGFVENVIEHMAEVLIVIDSEGKINMVNHAALEILGYKYEEIIGKPMDFIFKKTKGSSLVMEGSIIQKLSRDGVIKNLEIFLRNKTGERIPMVLSGSVMRNIYGEIDAIICVAKDLRDTKKLLEAKARVEAEKAKADELKRAYEEQQKLEAQLIQSEKLASLGQLAAGVAHEINNPLTGVLTSGHLLLKRFFEVDDPNREDIEIIVRETTRCREIVRQLLDFARQSNPKMVYTNITQLINETLSIMENQFNIQNIKIIKKLKDDIPDIMIDINQIEQVFINILLNSIEAMSQGGSIVISSNFDKHFVCVIFQDNGRGISEENIGKIFDPFFTTKSKQKGTGLGLAVSYGIIKRHNGTIEVKSKVNEGTTFIVKLPLENNLERL